MIRKPKLDDVEDLNELSKRSWIEGFSDILSRKDLQRAKDKEDFVTEESLKQNIESKGCLSLVYEVSSKVVGKARIAWTEDETHDIADTNMNEVQLRSFYVHPDYWSQGIGTSLLVEIIEKAPEWAETVKVEALGGSDAVEFYKNNGFEIVGSGVFSAEDTELVEDDYATVVLEKELD